MKLKNLHKEKVDSENSCNDNDKKKKKKKHCSDSDDDSENDNDEWGMPEVESKRQEVANDSKRKLKKRKMIKTEKRSEKVIELQSAAATE